MNTCPLKKILVFTFCFLLFSLFQNKAYANIQVDDHILLADSFIEVRTIENIEKAIGEYEKAIKLEPENYEALWKIARAYVFLLDIKTDAFIGKQDKYKSLLKETGKLAYNYADKAYQINPNGKEAIAFILQTYGYYVGSFGIFKAVFKGPAGHLKNFAKKLIKIDDTYYGCAGYQALGRLYYEAPWPVGSLKKSVKYYTKAIENAPDTLLPHYWIGMVYAQKKKNSKAIREFNYVIDNPSHHIESHVISVYKDKAAEHIKYLKEKKK